VQRVPNIKAPKIESVVRSDLCTACGACKPACPFENIEITYNTVRAAPEPSIKNATRCVDCAAPCDQVCPSIDTRLAFKSESARLGKIVRVRTGYSPEFQLNGKTSSGGVVKSVLQQRMSLGHDVICLVNTDQGVFGYGPDIVADSHQLDDLPGSIYHSVGFFGVIELLERSRNPVVIVAIPCHLSGLLNYIEKCNPSLNEKIALKVGIICGWMYSNHSIRNFLHATGRRSLDFESASYRGEGEVGALKVTNRGETIASDRRNFNTVSEYLTYKSSFATELNRMRCRVCEDHINLESDISFGDAWLERKTGEKISIIVTRSEVGEACIGSLEEAGLLISELGGIEDIIESQGADLVYGYTARKLRGMYKFDLTGTMQVEGSPSIATNVKERLSLLRESLLRWVVRRGWYKGFRFLYALTRIRSLIRFRRNIKFRAHV